MPIFGSGLFVVSKYPVKLLDHIYFKTCRSADCFASKGAALMEISLPGGQRIHVVNTHLQATAGAGTIRMRQMGQIHRMLLKYSDPDIPQFLIGDLNIGFNEPEFMMALNLLGMDYTNITGPILWTSGRANACYKVAPSSEWVDHMWFNNFAGIRATDMRVKELNFRKENKICPLSDHHAIEASFHF